MAAKTMVPDEAARVHSATLRNRSIDSRRRRAIQLAATTDKRRALLLQREDDPRVPEFCPGCHSLHVLGYLLGPRPDGVDCDRPLRVVCRNCDFSTVWTCGGHRHSKCRPCAARYRRRVRSLAYAGMHRRGGFYYLLTLTAPSDVHYYGRSGRECPCSVRGFNLAKWNTNHSDAWNLFRTRLAKAFPELEYFRAVETQDGSRRGDGVGRGALHDHVMLWVKSGITAAWVRKLAIECGFGHEIKLDEVQPDSQAVADYVSKYVTKSCDQRDDVPWWGDLIDFDTGEWLGEGLVHARFRTWSQSSDWGTTMAQIRAEASVWARIYADRELDPVIVLLAGELGAERVLDVLPLDPLVV